MESNHTIVYIMRHIDIGGHIEIPYKKVEELHLYRNEFASIEIPQLVLYSLGRANEIKLKKELHYMRDISKQDLRFSPAKEAIYQLLPEEFKKSYYELSKEKGYDLKRFYK